jgi:hypothetical protein
MDKDQAIINLLKALREIRDKKPKTWEKIVTPELMDAWDDAKEAATSFSDDDGSITTILRLMSQVVARTNSDKVLLPKGIVDRIKRDKGQDEQFVEMPLSEAIHYLADMYE